MYYYYFSNVLTNDIKTNQCLNYYPKQLFGFIVISLESSRLKTRQDEETICGQVSAKIAACPLYTKFECTGQKCFLADFITSQVF